LTFLLLAYRRSIISKNLAPPLVRLHAWVGGDIMSSDDIYSLRKVLLVLTKRNGVQGRNRVYLSLTVVLHTTPDTRVNRTAV